MKKQDMKTEGLAGYWDLFSTSYDDLIQSIIRPLRIDYQIKDLRATQFSVNDTNTTDEILYNRLDFQLLNPYKRRLECSFWSSSSNASMEKPCIVYAHGNSSSRLESLSILDQVLHNGYSFFAFDFAGAGMDCR